MIICGKSLWLKIKISLFAHLIFTLRKTFQNLLMEFKLQIKRRLMAFELQNEKKEKKKKKLNTLEHKAHSKFQ